MFKVRRLTAFKTRFAKGAKKIWKDLITRWRSFSPGFRYAAVYFLCVICIATVVWWQYNPGNSLVFDPEANSDPEDYENSPDDLVDLNPGENPEVNPEPNGIAWAAFSSGGDKLCLPLEGEILTAFNDVFQSFPSTYYQLEGVHIGGTRGDPVCAAWQGEVAKIILPEQNDPGEVWINHGDWETRYINLTDIIVSVGQKVSRGERLGELAARGKGMYSEDWLEFQVWGSDQQAHDPMRYVGLDR